MNSFPRSKGKALPPIMTTVSCQNVFRSSSIIFLALLVCLFSISSSSSSSSRRLVNSKIHIEGRWFVDESGRKRIFHGVNAVQKEPPWIPAKMLQNSTRIQQLADWGFNVVRLGMMWSGVEPQEGKVNVTYLQEMRSIVSELASRGIYVILDMHQDVASSRFGHYDGLPLWFVDSLPPSKHPFPWPFSHSPHPWALGYLTEAVGNAFQQLYSLPSSHHRMAAFWRIVAAAFKSFPSLLGYELINEPWAGDIYAHPALIVSAVAGRRNLAPLYEDLSVAIRAVDDESIVFFEPCVTWGYVQLSPSGVGGSGFDRVPGGNAYRNRTAFSYHYYCWILGDNPKEYPYPPWEKAVCNDVLGKKVFEAAANEQNRIGGGTFLTEFGDCVPLNETNECEQAEQFALQQADARHESWTFWESYFWDSNGTVLPTPVLTFARPYARAVAGTPSETSFDPKSRLFRLVYEADVLRGNDDDDDDDESIDSPTEIFLPRVQYPDGVSWAASPHLEVEYDAAASLARVRVRSAFRQAWKTMSRTLPDFSSSSSSSSILMGVPKTIPSTVEFFPSPKD